MAKHPNEPTSTVVIPAEFVQDPESGQWVLTTLQTPRLSARDIDVRRARRLLEKQLEEKLGKPVDIKERIKLPKPLAAELAEHLRKLDLIDEITAQVRAERMVLLDKFRRERLQQQQIADLLRVSSAWLGQQLKVGRTVTPTPKRER